MIKYVRLNYYFWKKLLQIEFFSELYQIVFLIWTKFILSIKENIISFYSCLKLICYKFYYNNVELLKKEKYMLWK